LKNFFVKFVNFVIRDFFIAISYKINLVIGMIGMFFGVLKFGFMAHFLQFGNSFPSLSSYGGSLISYLITGGIFMSYVNVAMNSFKSAIRSEQISGTLEYLLLSDTPIYQIIIFSGISNFLWTTLDAISVLLVVSVIFDMKMNINFGLSLFIILITIICISGIGFASAGIIMVTKKGDPIGWLFTTLTGVLSGVFYPISFLPKWIRFFSYLLPPTYALKALRKALLTGSSFASVKSQIYVLLLMTIITVPIGVFVFKKGYDRARVEGSLIEY